MASGKSVGNADRWACVRAQVAPRAVARVLGAVCASLALLIMGCSRNDSPGESVAQTQSALSTVMTRTYGFESLTDWSAIYSSPTLVLSNTRTEGLKSLAASGGGWSSFISRTLAKEEAAPTVVGFDLRIPTSQPNPTWYGTVELYVDIPSRGVNNQPLGLHMLTLWTPGQWRRAEFSVPASIQTAMNQSYSDLRWRVQLNVPTNSTGQYLFDRLAFGGTPPACTPVSDGNPCTMDQCNAQGQPVHIPVPAGTSCSDMNLCNGAETCNASAVCVAGTPTTCTASDQCHDAGTCNTSTGVCSNPAKANGVACSDGNACTQSDTCQAGACTGANPVTCVASDQCHLAGTCNTSTGVCSNPAKADGASCSDANACTQSDTCQSGTCIGANPVTCVASDACHLAGTCNTSTGVCSNPAKADGSSCADATVCNGAETCTAGTCVAGTAPAMDDGNPCTADSCNAVTGVAHTPVAAGTACADADLCNGAETCNAIGTCVAGTAVVCSASDQCHVAGTCNASTGVCTNPAKADGSSCSDANACTQSDTCQAGACVGASPVLCVALDACHIAGTCDASTGVCSNPAKPDGSTCADATVCNGAETCSSGSCVAGAPLVMDDANPCTADACDPVAGVTHTAVAAGTSCADSNLCNGAETCDGSGQCAAGTPVLCAASDQCHLAGTCDPPTGACSNPAKPDGSSCSDGNGCTTSDTCQAGACLAGNPVVCAASDSCHGAGVCDPISGACSDPVLPDGTACDDATICNGLETCVDGTCTAGTPIDVDDDNPCTADACDPVNGAFHDPAPAGTSCESDGNACNGESSCDAAGACQPGTPPSTDDGNPCTVDACLPIGGVTHTPVSAGTSCEDTTVCNGNEVCNAFGACLSGPPPTTDDGNLCTIDDCDPDAGVTHTAAAAGTSCSNGNACDGAEVCDGSGICSPGAPPTLDDGNPCTVDVCDAAGGVTHSPTAAGTSCADTNICNGTETCDGSGTCSPGSPPVLADANPCTIDTCDPATGVAHEPVPAGTTCSDADLCNGAEVCDVSGVCQPGTPVNTDDGNQCTSGSCDPSTGLVTQQAVAAGTSCNVTTCSAGTCDSAGTCIAGPSPADDGDPCTIDTCDPEFGITHRACPPLNHTLTTSVFEANEWLYTGADPIQVGVAPGTIVLHRAAVVQGRVLDRAQNAVPNAVVSILDHSEFGFTTTHADGKFVMVVNGGGLLTVDIAHNSYLQAQRQIYVPWNDYAPIPDIVVTAPDPAVTLVDLGLQDDFQVAEGTPQTDQDGTRRGTLLLPRGVQATMIHQDGTEQDLSTMNIRITEYTVGPLGQSAMPAQLPPESGYTYAFEVNADEAVAASAPSIVFSEPLIYYVDNFLGFPAGTAVPLGAYDRELGAWVASPSGVVIKIVGTVNGLAEVDLSGDGIADDEAALLSRGITSAERAKLAEQYPTGTSLWRVLLPHFTVPWDCNWGIFPPDDAEVPDVPRPEEEKPTVNEPDCRPFASAVECQNQIFRERLTIPGTDLSLNYSSARSPAFGTSEITDIPLTGASPPASLKRVEVIVSYGGRVLTEFFPPSPNLSFPFEWDGVDVYGRKLQGRQPIQVEIRYIYDAVYAETSAFMDWSGDREPITGDLTRGEMTLWNRTTIERGSFDARGLGLGGWTLSAHHVYSPFSSALELGTGDRVETKRDAPITSFVVGGGGVALGPGLPYPDLGPARLFSGVTDDIAIASDGQLFFTDSLTNKLIRVDRNGRALAVAGTQGGGGPGGQQDVEPAATASLIQPTQLAMDAEGTLYFSETRFANQAAYVIRTLRSDGMVRRFAGGQPIGLAAGGDDGPALDARLMQIFDIAVGADGSIYIAEAGNAGTQTARPSTGRIRRIFRDGTIDTIAGGVQAPQNEPLAPLGLAHIGESALGAPLEPRALAVRPDGTLYVIHTRVNGPNGNANEDILSIGPDGILRQVTSLSCGVCPGPDGSPALSYRPRSIYSAAFDRDGIFYFSADLDTGAGGNLRAILQDGTLRTLAQVSTTLDGGPAIDPTATNPLRYNSLAVGEGGLYGAVGITSSLKPVVRIGSTEELLSQGVVNTKMVTPGAESIFVFDPAGRHIRTTHGLTGGVTESLTYDTQGVLLELQDRAGLRTRLLRDALGNVETIEGPFGQRTTLHVDGNGWLSQIDHPDGSNTLLTTTADGLLTRIEKPNGSATVVTYDGDARVEREIDAAGGSLDLARVGVGGSWTVSETTALGRVRSYSHAIGANGALTSTVTGPAGDASVTTVDSAGRRNIASPDGTRRVISTTPDARFGRMDAVQSETTILPSGLTKSISRSRAYAGLDLTGGLPFLSKTDTELINGSQWRTSYAASTRTVTRTSPSNRTATETIDALGRVTRIQTTGLAPVTFSYDANGRPFRMVAGTGALARTTERAYFSAGASAGYLGTVTDALAGATTYARDAFGRVLGETRAGATTSFTWDEVGNPESVTPPGKPSHFLTFTPLNFLESYSPPPAGIPQASTSYAYDADRMLRTETRPGAVQVIRIPDSAGRLDTVAIPGGMLDYDYYAPGLPSGSGELSDISGPYNVDLRLTYDGRQTTQVSWSGDVAGTVEWDYNANFDRIAETVTGQLGTSFTVFEYDADKLLTCASWTSCSGTSATNALRITRDPQRGGVITGLSLGNTTEAWTYNTFGEIARQTSQFNASPIADITYDAAGVERDKLGRIVQKTETVLGTTRVFRYAYDNLRRLTDVTINGVLEEHFEYDLNGNRTTGFKAGVGTWMGTYDDQDRLLSYGPWAFTYTANGELETKTNTNTGDEWLFQYDALGNLLSVGLPNGDLVEYLVDGMGRRVGKMRNGVVLKQWIYRDELKPVAELDGSGNLVAQFAYGSKGNVPDYVRRGTVTYRVISDHLGSPRYAVNVNDVGDSPFTASYSSFGEATGTGLDWMPFGFAGGLHDAETGLVRLGARDYDPILGRWTSKDPVRFEGGYPNAYAYVGASPVDFVDPTGELSPGSLACLGLVATCLGKSLYDVVDGFNDMEACKDFAEEARHRLDQCSADQVQERRRIINETQAKCTTEAFEGIVLGGAYGAGCAVISRLCLTF